MGEYLETMMSEEERKALEEAKAFENDDVF